MTNDTKMNIQFSPPDITESEIREVVKTLESGWLTTGPKTKQLEQELADYIGVKKAVCLNSATSAMELTLRILGVGPGDEVITSAYTYTASASIIEHVGAKIVLIDTCEDSFEMDYEALSEAINEKTKVIIPVDLAGKMCDYDKIFSIVNNKKHLFESSNELQQMFNRVVVMADAAHSFGARRKELNSGQAADFTCFSFHAVKNLTTGEGGAVVWKENAQINNLVLYEQFMLFSLHGQSKDALAKTQKGSWEYDILYPAYKCNMTDITASIGLVQLSRYDELLKKRRNIINKYDSELMPFGLEVLEHYSPDTSSSGHLYLTRVPGITLQERNEIIYQMSLKGISCNVHYKPLPMFTAYRKLGFNIKDYPNSYQKYANEISLPLHTVLNDDEIEYITTNFKRIIRDYRWKNNVYK